MGKKVQRDGTERGHRSVRAFNSGPNTVLASPAPSSGISASPMHRAGLCELNKLSCWGQIQSVLQGSGLKWGNSQGWGGNFKMLST